MRDYKNYFSLSASPADVYNVLTNSVMIEIWTGEKAVMDPQPNAPFSLWDGAINGHTIECVEDKKIVQEWYFGGAEASIVTIKLHPDGEGTSAELRHTNIPADAYENMVEGWIEEYFGALAELFND